MDMVKVVIKDCYEYSLGFWCCSTKLLLCSFCDLFLYGVPLIVLMLIINNNWWSFTYHFYLIFLTNKRILLVATQTKALTSAALNVCSDPLSPPPCFAEGRALSPFQQALRTELTSPCLAAESCTSAAHSHPPSRWLEETGGSGSS